MAAASAAGARGVKRKHEALVDAPPVPKCTYTHAFDELTNYLPGDLAREILLHLAPVELQKHQVIRARLMSIPKAAKNKTRLPPQKYELTLTPDPGCGTPDCRYHYPTKCHAVIAYKDNTVLNAELNQTTRWAESAALSFSQQPPPGRGDYEHSKLEFKNTYLTLSHNALRDGITRARPKKEFHVEEGEGFFERIHLLSARMAIAISRRYRNTPQ